MCDLDPSGTWIHQHCCPGISRANEGGREPDQSGQGERKVGQDEEDGTFLIHIRSIDSNPGDVLGGRAAGGSTRSLFEPLSRVPLPMETQHPHSIFFELVSGESM